MVGWKSVVVAILHAQKVRVATRRSATIADDAACGMIASSVASRRWEPRSPHGRRNGVWVNAVRWSVAATAGACVPALFLALVGPNHSPIAVPAAARPLPTLAALPSAPGGGCPQVPSPTGRLLPGEIPTSATVCVELRQPVVGHGKWLIRQLATVTGPELAAIVTALRQPDIAATPGTKCLLMMVSGPPFWLTLADGRTVEPRVPRDGCQQSVTVTDLLLSTLNSAAVVISRVRPLSDTVPLPVPSGTSDPTPSPTQRQS